MEFTDELLQEFTRVFRSRNAIERLLLAAHFPDGIVDVEQPAMDLWGDVRTLVNTGVVGNAIPFVQAALATHPYNQTFRGWLDLALRQPRANGVANTTADGPHQAAATAPPIPTPASAVASPPSGVGRPSRGGFRLMVVSNLPLQLVLAAARHALQTMGFAQEVELGLVNDTFVGLVFPTATADQIASIREQMAAQLSVSPRGISVRSNTFQDYFMDLRVEGPDQRRYEINDVSASTPVGEVARALINTHDRDTRWTMDGKGRPRDVVVDRVREGKVERLKPDKSLDENKVRNGDLLLWGSEVRSDPASADLGFAVDRFALLRSMEKITDNQLDGLAGKLKMPAGLLRPATPENDVQRRVAVVQWAQSRGPGGLMELHTAILRDL